MTYIIESLTRGTLKFFISAEEFGFSTTGMRSDPEKTVQFDSLAHARAIWNRLPDRVRTKCDIRDANNEYEIVPMLKPIPHEIIVVSDIPNCDFCSQKSITKPGPYDFKTYMGPWAHGCKGHWEAFRESGALGEGKGQLWITKAQVA
jgi:hypothetical protein